MVTEIKKLMAEEVRAELDRSPNVLVVGLRPMDALQDLQLRSDLRGKGATLRVIHNRTSRHALDEERREMGRFFTGQTALALTEDPEVDLIQIAKTLVGAARKKQVAVRGGYVDGELLDQAGVEALARSPDKPTLRAMICGAINGPARGIAATLQGVAGGIARSLQARIEKQEETSQ
jgi:large subunit ribosomal protein L10